MTVFLKRLWPMAATLRGAMPRGAMLRGAMPRGALTLAALALTLAAPSVFAETHNVPLNQSLQAQESYFGLNASTTKIVGKNVSYLSLNGSWIFNEGLSFGLYLDSILAQHVANEENYNLKDVTLWNTGVTVGWQQEVVGPFLVRAQVKGGFGQFNYRDTREDDPKSESANLGVVTPELGVLLQVTDDVRLGVTGGYRYTSKPDVVDGLSVGARVLSAPVIGFELSLKTD